MDFEHALIGAPLQANNTNYLNMLWRQYLPLLVFVEFYEYYLFVSTPLIVISVSINVT